MGLAWNWQTKNGFRKNWYDLVDEVINQVNISSYQIFKKHGGAWQYLDF